MVGFARYAEFVIQIAKILLRQTKANFLILFITLLEIIGPVIGLCMIGFIWCKSGIEYRVEFVTRLSMSVSVPCLIFMSLSQANISSKDLFTITAATLTTYSLIMILSYILLKVISLDIRTFLAPLIFGNTGNIGLPLSYFAFGNEGLSYAIVIFSLMAIISFTLGIWMVSGGGVILTIVKEPLVVATLLGGGFLFFELEVPKVLSSTLDLIGQMAIPLMLITLGVSVARLRIISIWQTLFVTNAKVFICVISAFLIGSVYRLEITTFSVLILQCSTPVAVTSYLLANKYNADSEAVAALVILSTILSLLYIPLILTFLIEIYPVL